jgi:hypothetical protein
MQPKRRKQETSHNKTALQRNRAKARTQAGKLEKSRFIHGAVILKRFGAFH